MLLFWCLLKAYERFLNIVICSVNVQNYVKHLVMSTKKVYPSQQQKQLLVHLVKSDAYLRSGKFSSSFTKKDSERRWREVAQTLNALKGSRKPWEGWRKTWQDLKSKTKKREAECIERNGELSSSLVVLTQAEQEALGLKNISSSSNYQESTEFVVSESLEQDNVQESFNNDEESNASYSETQNSPTEEKVFTYPIRDNNITNHNDNNDDSKHSNNCIFSCNILAKQEQRKIQIKEDYLNFKKDYLRQKLKILKEQTEALKTIAKELSNK